MCSPGLGAYLLVAHNVVLQVVVAVRRVWDILIRQDHQVIVPDMYGPDALGGGKAMAIPDIVHSKF